MCDILNFSFTFSIKLKWEVIHMHNKRNNLKRFFAGIIALSSALTMSVLSFDKVFAENYTPTQYKLYDPDDDQRETRATYNYTDKNKSETTSPASGTRSSETVPSAETSSSTAADTTPAPSSAAASSNNNSNTGGSAALADVEWPEAPALVSKQAILMDADTGAILYEKDAYKRNYPASTTKILTGLLVVRNTALSETVTFSKKAADSVEDGDASLGMKEGEKLSVEQALSGLLLYSANEIAYGLAEHVSGSLDAFVEKMNDEAKKAGALDTHFTNASGLYNANHYSTPYDMALIARTCFNNPTFLQIDSRETYTIPATNLTNEPRSFTNRNKLLPGLMYGYTYCVGGKTGYLPEGGYTYVSYAEKDGNRLIAVCFDSTEDDRFADAEKLFTWGYKNFSKVSLSRSTITSPYSADSYLNPPRFTSNGLSRTFDASFVTLPNNADLSDVKISRDEKHTRAVSSTGVNIPVLFTYGTHTVGTASLAYTTSDSISGLSSLLPLEKADTGGVHYKVHKALPVDLRILITIGIIGLIAFLIISARKKREAHEEEMRKKRERRKRT